MRARALATITAVLAAALAGCGGDDASDDKTEVSWVAQAQGICRDATSQVTKLPEDLGLEPDDPGRAKERRIFEDKLERLRALDVPKDASGSFERMIKLDERSATAHEQFLAAAGDAANPQARATSVRLLRTQKRLGERRADIARDLDLTSCAGG